MRLNCHYIFDSYIPNEVYVLFAISLLVGFTLFVTKVIPRSFFRNVGLISLCLGGFSNIMERYLKGCVLDYLSFFGLFYFNLFDVLVCIGCIMLFFDIWKTLK